MLPKPLRAAYYWISHQGKIGYALVQGINWAFMKSVQAFGIKAKKDLTCLTIISHKYKFIYIGIPKTATRSFMNAFALDGKDIFESEWFETPAAYQKALHDHPDYFKFSFVRNPWARIVSCYNSKIADAVLGKQARIMSFYKNLKPGMSFSDFVHWLSSDEGADEYADRHWLSQNELLCDKNGALHCDFVGRYENLEEDLNTLSEKLGFPMPELKQKGFISQKKDYRELYDEDTQAIIAKRYAKDIELFNYEF